MSFLRHAEIYRSDIVCKSFESWGRGTASRWSAPGPAKGRDGRTAPCSSSAMSFRAGYSLAGCSPAEPASASPTALSMRWGMSAGNDLSANGNLSLVSVSQHRGAVQPIPLSLSLGLVKRVLYLCLVHIQHALNVRLLTVEAREHSDGCHVRKEIKNPVIRFATRRVVLAVAQM